MKSVDYKLFFAALALMIFGMVMISSVSVYGSFRVTSSMAEKGLIVEAYNHFYVLRNIIHVIIASCVIAIVAKTPYKFFEKNARIIFSIAIVLLVIVLIIGINLKGASGWISIPWIPFTIQPTEFLKFALIVYLASFFKQNKQYLHTLEWGFIPFLGILSLVVMLVALQPDFGTILVIVPLSVMIFFIAGANVKYLSVLTLLGMLLAFWVYLAGDYDPETGKNNNSLWYITQRIDNFLADNETAINNDTINYQTEQALIAIWSGGFWGLWFGNSIQKFWYLPEVQWDFIFSVIVEELGFIGAFIMLGIFGYIFYRGMYISRHSPEPFARYAAFGISTWILLQACINIWVNLNIIPLTGITLPFVSYGGSSLLSLSLWLGLLLSISRDINPEKYSSMMKRKKQLPILWKLWL